MGCANLRSSIPLGFGASFAPADAVVDTDELYDG